MEVMGAQLRKVSLKAGAIAAGFSFALSVGMALALHAQGQDPAQGLRATVPLFIGALAVLAGVNPARAPRLFVLVMGGAAASLALVQALVTPLT